MEGKNKRQKVEHIDPEAILQRLEEERREVRIKFRDTEGNEIGDEIYVDANSSKIDLNKILDAIMQPVDKQVYQFYLEDKEVRTSIKDVIEKLANQSYNAETMIPLTYKPEAMFRIRPVTRASSTLEGHSESVLSVCFSPDGKQLASASGDTTVRVWDLMTETPLHTCTGHKHWVLLVAFSPDCTKIASGGMDYNIMIWNAETGEQHGNTLRGHKNFISSLSWEPMIANHESRRMASSSKD